MLAIPVGATEDPVPIIGATLCLMSCVMQSGNTHYLAKIADNLAILAEHPNIDANFRRICRRLYQHWETCVNAQVNAQANDSSDGNGVLVSNAVSAKQIH